MLNVTLKLKQKENTSLGMFLIVFECVKLRDQKKSLLKKPLIEFLKKALSHI